MLKLDDLLTKKKEPIQILDLSKCTANNKEELKRLLEKVPEYKIKLEKVKPEDVHIKEKKFTFKVTKKELRSSHYPFANPIPNEMRSLRLEDLCSINIPWKMLTSLKPKSKIDEEYFSRVIDLGKLTLATRKLEKNYPNQNYIKKMKNRAGVTEIRTVICSQCGEGFCLAEECKNFTYDLYQRINNLIKTSSELLTQQNVTSNVNKKSKKKRKRGKKLPLKKKKKINVKKTGGKLNTLVNKNMQSSIKIVENKIDNNKPDKKSNKILPLPVHKKKYPSRVKVFKIKEKQKKN